MDNPYDRREIKRAQLEHLSWLVDYYRHAWQMGHRENDALRRVVAELRVENARLRDAVSG